MRVSLNVLNWIVDHNVPSPFIILTHQLSTCIKVGQEHQAEIFAFEALWTGNEILYALDEVGNPSFDDITGNQTEAYDIVVYYYDILYYFNQLMTVNLIVGKGLWKYNHLFWY